VCFGRHKETSWLALRGTAAQDFILPDCGGAM
jgi:hypothetical protein